MYEDGILFSLDLWEVTVHDTEKETVHLRIKDDIPYLVGNRNSRVNRHRPLSENIIECMKMLKEVIGVERDGDEGEAAEADEEIGEPHARVEAVDFGPPGGVKMKMQIPKQV